MHIEMVSVCSKTYQAYSHENNKEAMVVVIGLDRNLNNILMCSSLVMSDCGLLLELGSSHSRGQCEFLYSQAFGSSLPLGHRHDT